MNRIHYRTERFETTVSVEKFYRDCVDVDYFLGLCKQCPNYGKIWSCPAYDFDVRAYWKKYQTLKIIGTKVFVPDEIQEKTWTPEEMKDLYRKILLPVRKQQMEELFELEQAIPGSVQLGAGSCVLCAENTCARLEGKPCRFPDKMRYSIESLGGNVSKAAEYIGQTMEWAGEDRLPHYFLLVCGLLYNNAT